jgi:hypothetical protein
MKCPLCGAPECPNNENWDDCDQNLLYAGAYLLAALKYMLENAESQGWSEMMLSDARAAIDKAEGRGE